MAPTLSEPERKVQSRRPEPLAATCNWNTVKTLGRRAAKHGLPPSPTSPQGVLISRNGPTAETRVVGQPCGTDDGASLILPSLDGDDKENHGSHVALPATPNSSAFPPSISDSSINSTKSPSAKSVRWAEISVFPEQQSLLNIRGLLKTLIEESEEEVSLRTSNFQICPLMPFGQIKDVCILLQDYLPQPGVPSERKYTLRSTQEEELEHALRILDGALYRNLDAIAVDKAKRTLKRLAPIIQVLTDAILLKRSVSDTCPLLQLRFATLPFHREVERLKAERLQLKEERALVLVQLAIQESEIKSAQLRREAERNREIEEAAMRRMKRREEKMREKQTYLGFRKLLEERSEELMELNQKIASENERLLAARQERDKKNLERTQKTLPLRIGLGGSVRMTSARQGDKTKCWI
jgi:hypothetical protein